MINNKDFIAFQKEARGFLKPASAVILKENELRLSEEFRTTFPLLTALIEAARVTFLEIDQDSYILFAWDTPQNSICGWLNKTEEEQGLFDELIPEHKLLLRNTGGIVESFNQPDDSFSNNQNFMFIGSKCSKGIGDWDDYYLMMCEEENKEPMGHAHLMAFAKEANGALTLYDPNSSKVILFSHDHSFDNVSFVEDQPEYTFHNFMNSVNFVDYVEELANQWMEHIKK